MWVGSVASVAHSSHSSGRCSCSARVTRGSIGTLGVGWFIDVTSLDLEQFAEQAELFVVVVGCLHA